MDSRRKPDFDRDELLRTLRRPLERVASRFSRGEGQGGGRSWPLLLGGLVAVLLVIWLGTGVYSVDPGQQAALRLFGEFRGTEGPGLHWYPPAPIGTRNIVNVQETKEIELGFRTGGPEDVEEEALMITGDLNIVNVHLVVQYRVKNLREFLFRVADPGDPDRPEVGQRPDGRTLKDAAEASLRQVIGQRGIDDVLTVEKEAVQADTARSLQEILDDYEAGIDIQQVVLQNVRPPDEVRQAFDDVVAARVDQESRINEGNSYRQDRVPRARGAAEQTVQKARGFKEARIAEARGEAAEFEAILEQYSLSRDVTRRRLFLETMEKMLAKIDRLYVLDGQGENVLPFLPLTAQGLPRTPTPVPSPQTDGRGERQDGG